MNPNPLLSEMLTVLRAEVRAIESAGRGASGGEGLAFGIESIDSRLAGGGLAAAALHEAAGDRPGLPDEAAATLFLASLAARREGMVLWALARRDLFAPGLQQAGLSPERLLYAECGRDEEVLAVMEEGLRHGGLAAVVGEAGRGANAAPPPPPPPARGGGKKGPLLQRPRRGRGGAPRLSFAPGPPPRGAAP